MSNEIFIASGYAMAWIVILAGFAYAGLKLSQKKPEEIKISAEELYERSRKR